MCVCVCVALCACACACVRAWRGVPPRTPQAAGSVRNEINFESLRTLSVKWSKIMAIFNRMRLRTSIYIFDPLLFCLLSLPILD